VRSLRRALQDLPHLNMRPPTAAGRSDLAGVELAGDGVEARMAARLHLSNERQDIGRELTRPRLEGVAHAFYCACRVGSPETRPPRLGRREGRLGALGNRFALMLGHRRQDMQRQLVGVRIIDRNELNAGIHERCDKGQVSGQPIQLGNDQLGFVLAAGLERPHQLRPICPLAALNLNEFGHDFPCTAVEVAPDGLLLGFEAKPAAALAVGTRPVLSVPRFRFTSEPTNGRPALN
jgi:hypothetical protein